VCDVIEVTKSQLLIEHRTVSNGLLIVVKNLIKILIIDGACCLDIIRNENVYQCNRKSAKSKLKAQKDQSCATMHNAPPHICTVTIVSIVSLLNKYVVNVVISQFVK